MTPAQPQKLPNLFTIKDVAAYAKVSPKTVRRWIDAKELPVYRLGRAIRISEEDLRAFTDKKRAKQQ